MRLFLVGTFTKKGFSSEMWIKSGENQTLVIKENKNKALSRVNKVKTS